LAGVVKEYEMFRMSSNESYKQLKRRCQNLNAVVERLTDQNKAHIQNIDNAKQIHLPLQNRLANVNYANSNLEIDLSSSNGKAVRLQNEIKSFKKKVSHGNAENLRLHEQLHKRDVAANQTTEEQMRWEGVIDHLKKNL